MKEITVRYVVERWKTVEVDDVYVSGRKADGDELYRVLEPLVEDEDEYLYEIVDYDVHDPEPEEETEVRQVRLDFHRTVELKVPRGADDGAVAERALRRVLEHEWTLKEEDYDGYAMGQVMNR